MGGAAASSPFVDVLSTTTFELRRAAAALATLISEVRPGDESGS